MKAAGLREVGLPTSAASSSRPPFELDPSLSHRRARSVTRPDGPRVRRLQIYALDPAQPKLEGSVVTVAVPYEPLEPGPVGALLKVDPNDAVTGCELRSADLDHPFQMASFGYAPSPTDPRFHQQMVYAVCSGVIDSFRIALGRGVGWRFGHDDHVVPLHVRPHAGEFANASYTCLSPFAGEIRFGFTRHAGDGHGCVFSSLSHDVIAHEVTHALLDGLRPCFLEPTCADVLGFHEGFADLVALFHHFSHTDIVRAALRQQRGRIDHANFIGRLAVQFGGGSALRSTLETDPSKPTTYNSQLEPHALGSVLVNSVFEAFCTLFARKTARLVRLASGGTGVLADGELPHELLEALCEEAAKLARQLLRVCIRAIDYCPPTRLHFGDYLRALVTADADVMPDDPWDYRGALINAFSRRGIHARGVANLSVDALLWEGPLVHELELPELGFAQLRLAGDPAHAAEPVDIVAQARILGAFATRPDRLAMFGLAAPNDPALGGDTVSIPQVRSIRTSRRSGDQGQVQFDLVAEITQERTVRATSDQPSFAYTGGSTVILDPEGKVRYLITKPLTSEGGAARRKAFVLGDGLRWWKPQGARHIVPDSTTLTQMCAQGAPCRSS